MTGLQSVVATTPHPDHAAIGLSNDPFSYLDIAALILADWQLGRPDDDRTAEEVAAAVMSAFSAERLHALVLAHLLA